MSQADDHDSWSAWFAAAGAEPIYSDLAHLYERVDAEIALRKPTCFLSGRCCRFDEFGHLLYVTGLEIAWVLTQARRVIPMTGKRPPAGVEVVIAPHGNAGPAGQHTPAPSPQPPDPDVAATINPPSVSSGGGCPFQNGTLCSVHTIRPLGCRIFFCEAGTADWQQQLYERFLGDIRRLHEDRRLPYQYMEWRAGLQAALRVKTNKV
ncbi:MAG: YkgJ family cysteine cluster protein [Phycisphaeraceae bacterium]|nr:YkgJ family cysteine cluster protein [Phycisphaeraceae bacterium]